MDRDLTAVLNEKWFTFITFLLRGFYKRKVALPSWLRTAFTYTYGNSYREGTHVDKILA